MGRCYRKKKFSLKFPEPKSTDKFQFKMTYFYCEITSNISENEIGILNCLSHYVREMYGIAGLATLQLECLLTKGNYFIIKADKKYEYSCFESISNL